MHSSNRAMHSESHIAEHTGLADAVRTDISSGVPAMDRLHHDLFSALDALSRADDRHFGAQFSQFVGAVEMLFREEEAWMDDLDYPEVAMHQEQHARVLGALHHVHAQVMDGDLQTGRHVVDELLPQWLLFHISTMDTPFAATMQRANSVGEFALHPY